MATFDLTVSPGYVENWGAWEALRELLQNALDEQENGHPFSLNWTKGRGGTLVIKTDGAVIERRHLVLGETSKRDDIRMRGKFGEGFKLALLVLARLGITVRLQTGAETWHPEIADSAEFGTKILRVRTTPRKFEESVEYHISPIDEESYKTLRKRILPLRSAKLDAINTSEGRLLLDPELKGHLFVKGIFVNIDTNASYGYDFNRLDLDRDRKMADIYSLGCQMKYILSEAAASGKLSGKDVLQLAEDTTSAEGRALGWYGLGAVASEAVHAAFVDQHGADAVAVASIEEAAQAAELGIKAVVVSKAVRNIFGDDNAAKKIKEAKEARSRSVKRVVQWHELTREQQARIHRAILLLKGHLDVPMRVVEFNSDRLLGLFRKDADDSTFDVALSEIDKSVGDLVSTIAHELAHATSMNHDDAHGEAMAKILASAINNLMDLTIHASQPSKFV